MKLAQAFKLNVIKSWKGGRCVLDHRFFSFRITFIRALLELCWNTGGGGCPQSFSFSRSGWDSRVFISDKFPSDIDAANLGGGP